MAFYVDPPSQFERALRALMVLQQKASTTWDNTYIANSSSERTLPNKTFLVSKFNPTVQHRLEGTVACEIQHHFRGLEQPADETDSKRVAMAAFIGDTLDTIAIGQGSQGLIALADAITTAGRWLATTDNTTEGDKIATDNADMANFRCDWVKFGDPLITRGNDENTNNWVEIVHVTAQVSQTAAAN